ncbi:MAG TPA: hypothetical protein EYG99_01760 [Candidatus Pacebacteria bacterium]|nr:hypothetical protein [Candidatus Paceibacterota bacterium]
MRLFSGKDRSNARIRVHKKHIESAQGITEKERQTLLAIIDLNISGFAVNFDYVGSNYLTGRRKGVKYELLLYSFRGDSKFILLDTLVVEKDGEESQSDILDMVEQTIEKFLAFTVSITKQ